MKATDFPEANSKLLPPEGEEERVHPISIWRHHEGGMVISKWKMTWRERLSILWKGHVWFHSWGNTHPPITIETAYPFVRDTDGLMKGIKWAAAIMIPVWVLIAISLFLYFNGGF